MGTIQKVLCFAWIAVLLSSCYTYREVVSKDQVSDDIKIEAIKSKLEPGDIIDITVRGKKYFYLEVERIDDPYLVVLYWDPTGYNRGSNKKEVFVRIDQIDELQFYDMYKEVGGPFLGLMIILYLLV